MKSTPFTTPLKLRLLTGFLALSLIPSLSASVIAGSATWNTNPTSNDWFTASNWTPQTVPDDIRDIATFGVSNITGIMMASSSFAYISGITFAPGASAYTFAGDFSFAGQGVINSSGIVQSFKAIPAVGFSGNATAGEQIVYDLHATQSNARAAFLADKADAGGATFFVHGQRPGDFWGAIISFEDHSTAANITVIDYGPEGGQQGAETTFDNFSSAGDSHITLYSGAWMDFSDSTTAANSVLTIDGGELDFEGKADGAQAQITLTNGGLLKILGRTGDRLHRGQARRSWNPGSDRAQGVFSIGSLAGDGMVQLSNEQISIGSNGQSTTFSGVIEQAGASAAVSKIGSGTLTLSGLNTYTGGTTVTAGNLLVSNTTGSVTGTGPVQVNGGTFGGRSHISGAVTIGSGSGTDADLAPGINGPGMLSLHKTLTFNSDGTYSCDLNTNNGKADQIICKGVTIKSGAQFNLQSKGNQTLPAGTVFTVINNRSRLPISGTFANLADNSIVSVGPNTFQASYEGGDGNDLTLTVQ